MKQKSFTSLEQSKKLAEILPLESADMAYIASATDDDGETLYTAEYISEIIIHETDDCINCWSLAALLDILPCNLKLVLAINDYQGERKERYAIGSVEHNKYDCYADNPVDACYEMILKLHEQNLL